jgi:hypothetical protein
MIAVVTEGKGSKETDDVGGKLVGAYVYPQSTTRQ